MPFLSQAFAPIISAIFNALAASAATVNDEEARLERQSLQRSYFSFIAAIVGSGLMEVLASQDSAILQQVLVSLVQGAVDYPDPVVSNWFCNSVSTAMKHLVILAGPEDVFLHSPPVGGDLGRQGWTIRVCRIRLQANSSSMLSGPIARHF